MAELDLTGVRWLKSSWSNQDSACVEVAFLDGYVAVRDSRMPTNGVLTFSATAWGVFLAGVRAGEFDREPGN
jgi:hypothetical protein